MKRALRIIEAPSDLGLKPTGVRGLPHALRSAGLLDGLTHELDDLPIEIPGYDVRRDPTVGVLNAPGIRDVSIRLADHVERALDADRFPLVLGGDCSILLGSMLALRRRGRYGLLFLDGHADFYSPGSEPSGEVASMELAIATGREPRALADLEGLSPLVREEDVVLLGYRDAGSAAEYGSPDVRETTIMVRTLEELRDEGPAVAVRRGIEALRSQGVDGYWIHLDADVLHDDVMPAVDYRMPGGLQPEELAEMLRAGLSSPLATGLEVTIYNPALDDTAGSGAGVLARVLRQALREV